MLLGHVADHSEYQAYVLARCTQVRRIEGKAKQGKLRSVVELVGSTQASNETRQTSGLVLVLDTSYLTHPRWRTSKSHGVVALPLPRAASSAAIVSSLTPSPLYSLPEHPAVFLPPPSSDPCNESLYTRRDNTAYTEHTFLSCRPYPNEAIPAVTQPTTHSQSFTCRLPRPVLLLGATLLRIKASAILLAVE